MAPVAAFVTMAGSAWAEGTTKICVPETASKPVLSASATNECPTKSTTKYKTEALPGPAEMEALDKILPHVKYIEAGVGGKPTVQFSGVNLQVVSGSGSTKGAVNGEGNVVIGYDENPGTSRGKPGVQTGSNNQILGEEQEFTSYGGIVAGRFNTVNAEFASVMGDGNGVSGNFGVVSGGTGNSAVGQFTSVSGGTGNTASGEGSSASGGAANRAIGIQSSVSGGQANTTVGRYSSIFGGHGLEATKEYEAIP
jgi:hypothetical protein